MVEPHDRRPAGRGPRGRDDPRRLRGARDRHADALLRRHPQPANACRVCVVEVEGARVLVPSCSRKVEPGMVVQTDSERVRHSRKMVLEFLGSSVDLSITPAAQDYLRALRRRLRALRAARAAGYRARPAPHRPPRGARRADRRHRGPAGQGRQRALRARLLQVHPLLQVRRRLRRAVAEHVRDRRGRPRLRRAHLDRVRQSAARLGLRLLRQLHRGLPDRRADVRLRVRPARGRRSGTSRARRRPTPSAPTAASAAPSRCTSRTTRSSRSPRPTTTTSRAATSASRAASASSTSSRSPATARACLLRAPWAVRTRWSARQRAPAGPGLPPRPHIRRAGSPRQWER